MSQIRRVLAWCRSQCSEAEGLAVALVQPLAPGSQRCFPRPDRELVVRQDRGALAVASVCSFVVRLLRLCRDWGVSVANHQRVMVPSYDGKSIMMLHAKT